MGDVVGDMRPIRANGLEEPLTVQLDLGLKEPPTGQLSLHWQVLDR